MSTPVRKLDPERIVEERIARLEATVEHIQSDVTEIKADIRRLDGKIDALERSMRDAFESLRLGRVLDRVWMLLAMGALLAVMARGFKWI